MNKLRSSKMILLAAVTCAFMPAMLQADTNVSGAVHGHWTRNNSPYLVVGHLTVNAGDSLVIDPGVEVVVMNRWNFDVSGILYAVGQGEDSIRIYHTVGLADSWRSLKFSGAGARGSRLERCVIRHANRGIELDGASPTFVNCRIANHADAGIRMVGSSSPHILGCVITAIETNGISVTETSSPTIKDCEIFDVGQYGIGVGTGSTPAIQDNYVHDTGADGIYLTAAGATTVTDNRVFRAGQRGILLLNSARCRIERNIVYRSTGPGIMLNRSDFSVVISNTIYESGNIGLHQYASSGQINSNIIAFSDLDGIYAQDAQPEVSFNDVYGSGRDDYSGLEPGGDINVDPLLVSPAQGDFTPQAASPVIDHGDQRYTDPDGTRLDIGAKFFNQNHPPVIDAFSPENTDTLAGDVEIEFSVTASDSDNHQLTYAWYVNGDDQQTGLPVFRHTFVRDGAYNVQVEVNDGFYLGITVKSWNFVISGAAVREMPVLNPGEFALSEPYPNPFNSSFNIDVELESPGRLLVELRDLSGRTVLRLTDQIAPAGVRKLTCDAESLPGGVYIISAEWRGRS